MNTITIDSKIYKGAEMYAKLHNISVERLVEKFLQTFLKPSSESESITEVSEKFLDALDEDLMKQSFEVAHQDYLAGRCIPNSQMVDYIKSELGWK